MKVHNKYYLAYPNCQANQQGSTLMVVLLVLLLVTSIAAVSMRRGNTDLKVATADQVEKLLFQANDAAFLKVEKEDRLKAKSVSLADLKGFITSDRVKEKESVSLCLRPKKKYLFNLRQITVQTEAGADYNSFRNGICDPSNGDDYITAKSRVLTQMVFVKDAVFEGKKEKFANQAKGTESNDMEIVGNSSNGTCVKFTGYATSVLPGLSKASEGTIKGCLGKGFHENRETTRKCLDDAGAVFQTQVQTYQNVPSGYSCL